MLGTLVTPFSPESRSRTPQEGLAAGRAARRPPRPRAPPAGPRRTAAVPMSVKQTPLLCRLLHCDQAAETALRPLIWCSGSLYSYMYCSPEACFFHRHRYHAAYSVYTAYAVRTICRIPRANHISMVSWLTNLLSASAVDVETSIRHRIRTRTAVSALKTMSYYYYY